MLFVLMMSPGVSLDRCSEVDGDVADGAEMQSWIWTSDRC